MCFGVVWIDRLPKFTSFTVTLILLISSGKNEIVSTLAMKSDEKENGRKEVCNVVTSECIFSMSNSSMLLNKFGCFCCFIRIDKVPQNSCIIFHLDIVPEVRALVVRATT